MFSIVQTSWQKDAQHLSQLRRRIFIEEQYVPESLEWDGRDDHAVHLLAWDLAANAIGCARLMPDFHLGRMAVLPQFRGIGVGTALLQAALDYAAAAQWQQVQISAQTQAIGFYSKAGFIVTSEEYMDAGIAHRDMCLYLNPIESL